MRRIRFQVAYRLDGCIAVPSGEHDWIIVGPEIDFPAMFDAFETRMMGRRTFKAAG